MIVRGVESRSITIDVTPAEAIDSLKTDWLSRAVGYDDAYPSGGKWYPSFYAACPDDGDPSDYDVIREVADGEEEIFHSFDNLKYFYQQEKNKEWEKERVRAEQYGVDED